MVNRCIRIDYGATLRPMKFAIILIGTLSLLAPCWAGGGNDNDTLARLEALLALKERADRAKAQQATAEWASQGQYMVHLRDRSREAKKLRHWTPWVMAQSEATEARDAIRITPAGLLYRDAQAAYARGDMEVAHQYLEMATNLANNAQARRAAIAAKRGSE